MLPRLLALRAGLLGTVTAMVVSLAPVTTAPAQAAGPAQPASTSSDPSALVSDEPGAVEPEMTTAEANAALETAERVVQGKQRGNDPDSGQAMRALFEARPRLGFIQSFRAMRLLARPTDGSRDPHGFGYSAPSKRTCGPQTCVHWVSKGSDRVPNRAWVDTTLRVTEQVATRTRKLGWPAPAGDGKRGGNAKLDVYLKNFGNTGTYGYCVGEKRISRQPARATSYCVLDNDFAARQYGGNRPIDSLRVTAAHEYFHAVQFNLDHREDVWFMESTATWMEEKVYDGINDNRQYLRNSQIATPHKPLDTVDMAGRQYSAWIFWEYLAKRYGRSVVRQVWRVTARKGVTSTVALRRVMSSRGGLNQVFADYIAATALPQPYWPEGSAYARHRARSGSLAPVRVSRKLSTSPSIDHLAGTPYRVRPGGSLPTDGRLRIDVSVPVRRSMAVTVLVRPKSGRVVRRTLAIDRTGKGHLTVGFGRGKVKEVVVALGNAGTRYRCGMNTSWSCQGLPRDDDRRVNLSLTPVA